ncbi:hypothetical protein JTE90_027393 [Oedothorax gibbosus]|uniref:Matrix-remodeling-associated protein 7 helical domain-containing protein n=1 Tax=Oedothorax gibbosus TaxID=931172 RepID=A0AAV6W4A8_9ARAC|nr:hypothetical protein JTE90_027393 [Oedothorax gibbosus]
MIEFVNWTDVFLEHYIFSIIISFLVIIVTLIISKFYKAKGNVGTFPDTTQLSEDSSSKQMDEEVRPAMLKHPVVVAEKVIEANMTDEQRQREHEVRRKQLSQIFELMQKQTEKFGDVSLTEIEEQFKLYQ